MKRLPRRLKIAGYVVEAVLVTQAVLRDIMEHEDETAVFEGAWEPLFEDTLTGRIYIDSKLPSAKRRQVFFHELIHAVNDIKDWDGERRTT